jgi:hypothetical protein
MYIDIQSGEIEESELTKKIGDRNFRIYWEGLLFYPGIEEGFASSNHLLNSLRHNDSAADIITKTERLRGNWSIFIKSLNKKNWIACTDHSHHSPIFYNELAISTSLLVLMGKLPNRLKLSNEAVMYFLSSGLCLSKNLAFNNNMQRLDYRW